MHVYVHVPFCARRCSYCDFAIAVRKAVPSEAYVSMVLREWELWQSEQRWQESPDIRTIYFGGGTPSRLSPDAIGRLLERLGHDRHVETGAEITLEANPDDVTPEVVRAWRGAGVNRISLGVQSFDSTVLGWMHRVHTVDQIFRAVEAVRGAGIGDLSVDLIFGLPRSQNRDWYRDLERAFMLEPEHVSLYGLTVEAHTPLGHWASRGEVTPMDDETYATEFLAAHAALIARGYDHYEVSNAGRPGHRARHNSAYWQRAAFIGLGPSAHTGLGRERRWNVRDWSAYERLLSAGKSPLEGRELLDDEAVSLEELYLGLRTTDGLASHRVPPDVISRWEKEGWAATAADRVRLSPEGWLRLDALIASIALPSRSSPLDSKYADARSAQ
jgi:oxygen-independent coproporphyrinogen-3 oxidase